MLLKDLHCVDQEVKNMSNLNLNLIVPWAPHPDAAPLCMREDANALVVAANGTRTCVGGWQLWSPPQIEVVPEPAPQRRLVRVSVVTGHAYARLGRTFATVQDEVQGSCIVDRKGEILAWNEGDRD
jgi:hypothetical protein